LVGAHDSGALWSAAGGMPRADEGAGGPWLPDENESNRRDKTGYFVVGLLSAALLAQEMIWTRLFSAELLYTFAFLILSLAVAGLGLGALAARGWPRLGDRRWLPWVLAASAASTLAGPPLVFALDLELSRLFVSWSVLAKLVAAIALLASASFFGGIALATLFRRRHQHLAGLYAADLVGAGLGAVLAILLMDWFGTPAAAFLAALPVVAASALAARGWARLAPVPLVVAMGALLAYGGDLLAADRAQRAPVIYQHWDATAKVKIYDFGEEARGIEVDNLANSPVYGFDGNWDRPDREPFQFGIDVSHLIGKSDHCRFLSLGAGGGTDVLQALQAGATEIHAVEFNGHVNYLMQSGMLAGFSGHIYSDPRVRVVTDDARAYVRRHRGSFDVIYSLSSNTFAALTSGAFAMAESYLFTTEAFRDYWRALSDGGFLMMEHQFYMPRLVSSLIDALRAEGVAEPRAHFAVYELPKMRRKVVLLSRRPLDDETRAEAFGRPSPDAPNAMFRLYPAEEGHAGNLIERIVLEGWQRAAADAPVDISPTTDDRPFVGQMGLWRNFDWERPDKLVGLEVFGFPLSTLILLAILAAVAVVFLPLTLLPYLGSGPRLGWAAWLYFFSIGVAYMAVEVVLIQKYTLLAGPSAHGTATIVASLLISSGLGSRMSVRLGDRAAFAALAALLVLEVFVLGHVAAAATGMPPSLRLLVTALLVSPLGFFMGMPFPKGARRVGARVDWGLAVTGTASVLGATAVLFVAMSHGFRAALLASALFYACAFALLARREGWSSA